MLESITEDCTFHLITGILASIFLGSLYLNTRNNFILYAVIGIVIVTTTIFVTEQMIVTDRERLTKEIYELADAVENNHQARVLQSVDKSMETTIKRIESEMPMYKFELCNISAGPTVTFMQDNSSKAKVEFTVFVRVGGREFGQGQRAVELSYQKNESDQWKITNYRHFDPRENLSL